MRPLMLISFILFAAACTEDAEDAPCGVGSQLVNGTCRESSVDAAPTVDAGPGAADAPSASVAFGATCSDSIAHTDCRGETDYCVKRPGRPGYCSHSGCDSTPSICPAGWGCFNLAQLIADQPWVCARP